MIVSVNKSCITLLFSSNLQLLPRSISCYYFLEPLSFCLCTMLLLFPKLAANLPWNLIPPLKSNIHSTLNCFCYSSPLYPIPPHIISLRKILKYWRKQQLLSPTPRTAVSCFHYMIFQHLSQFLNIPQIFCGHLEAQSSPP